MHVHQSIWKDGKNLMFAETGYAQLSDTARYYIGGLLQHAASILAIAAPTTNSYRRLGPGLRSAGEPRVLAAQPLGVRADPGVLEVGEGEAARVPSGRTRRRTRTSRSRDADGRHRRDHEQDRPRRRGRQEHLRPSARGGGRDPDGACRRSRSRCARSRTTTTTCSAATSSPRTSSSRGSSYKWENEVDAVRLRPHPHEFAMYYDI